MIPNLFLFMDFRVIASAVIEKDGCFLLGKKPANVGPYPNTWHLPGGGVKLEDESILEALKREIREETHIELSNIEPISFDEDYEPNKRGVKTHYVFLVFKAKWSAGEAKAADDLTELRWVPKAKLKELPLTMPSIKLFKELRYL